MPLLELKIFVFHIFLLHTLIYWKYILYITLFSWTSHQIRMSSISVNFWRSYPLLNLNLILEINSFPHFSTTFFCASYLTYNIGITVLYTFNAHALRLSWKLFCFVFLFVKYHRIFKIFMTGVSCTVCGALVPYLKTLMHIYLFITRNNTQCHDFIK